MARGKRNLAGKIGGLQSLQWLMLCAAAVLIARGVWPLRSGPWAHLLADLLLILASAVLGFILLLVVDYTLHHAFIVFCGMLVLLIYLSWLHPDFAAGMGVALFVLVLSGE